MRPVLLTAQATFFVKRDENGIAEALVCIDNSSGEEKILCSLRYIESEISRIKVQGERIYLECTNMKKGRIQSISILYYDPSSEGLQTLGTYPGYLRECVKDTGKSWQKPLLLSYAAR